MANNEIPSNIPGERVELSNHEEFELQEHLRAEREKNAERSKERYETSAESARHEIENINTERETRKREIAPQQHVERKVDSKQARKKAYESIMKQTQAEMSAPERAFSQFIHNPVIDKVSSVAANTIARPDAILSGSIFAFLLTLVIYLIAKQSGYPLTGTETIAAFIAGWVLGNLYDYVRIMVRGGR